MNIFWAKKATWLTTLLVVPSLAMANYQVQITNPSQDRAYIRPAESVEIALAVEPSLQPLDTLVLKINGQLMVANQTNYTVHSVDLNPGMHTIEAQVQDETGKVIASDTRTIHLIQNTQLMRENKAKAEAQAAYDAAPWYKKIALKLAPQKQQADNNPLLLGVPVQATP